MAIKDFITKLINKEGDLPKHFTNTGSTGTEIYSGYYDEEYLDKFQNMPEGMDIYDEMRRSDYQVHMLLSLTKIPLTSATWGIESVDDSDEEKEIADFVEYCLLKDISYPNGSKHKTFKSFISEALTSLDFGYSLFEPVYKVVTDHPTYGTYIGLKDIAFRSQKTIYEWNLNSDGSINNVRQVVDGDLAVDVSIPGENLLVITLNKEGDNYEGISALRFIYGNWFKKKTYDKIHAIGLERTATGVPIAYVPTGLDDKDQMKYLINMLERVTSNQKNYMIFPQGYEVGQLDIKYDAASVLKTIQHEDQAMAKAFMAGFMELGLGGKAGSQSLGADLSTIFLNGIKSYAQMISEAVNYNIIKKLVDAKYGKRVEYPTLKANDIVSKNSKEIAETLVMLTNSGLLNVSDKLQDYVTREFDLPMISEEDRVASSQNDEEVNQDNNSKPNKEEKREKQKLSEKKNINPSTFIKQSSKDLTILMQALLSERIDSNIEAVAKKLKKAKDVKAKRVILKENKLPDKAKYLRVVKGQLAKVTREAYKQVTAEIPKANLKFDEVSDLLKTLPIALRSKLVTTIEKAISKQDAEIEDRMFFIASEKLDTTESVNTLISDMQRVANDYVASNVTNTTATNLASNMVNSARNDVFQTPQVFNEIESYIIVNPDPDAAICKELAGRVFSKDEYINQDLPPYHHNCETTIRAQYVGQKNNKPINPIGLAMTGTQEEIERKLKSKTF